MVLIAKCRRNCEEEEGEGEEEKKEEEVGEEKEREIWQIFLTSPFPFLYRNYSHCNRFSGIITHNACAIIHPNLLTDCLTNSSS